MGSVRQSRGILSAVSTEWISYPPFDWTVGRSVQIRIEE